MTGLVTLGEAMAVVAATSPGPLRTGGAMRLGFAGAEATVAIGVSRLGHQAAWIGRVGDDTAGTMILSGLRAEGVDVTHARVDPAAPTGLMLRELRTADRVRATYYREGLAGSRLDPDDLDNDLLTSARVLHLTGITPALGDSARAAVRQAAHRATSAGVLVSLDVNYRAQLWSREEAATELAALIPHVDLVFAGMEEAALLVDETDPARAARALRALGPREAVIKLGAEGALAAVDDTLLTQPATPVTCVDPIGAGDAFVSGYLAGLLAESDPAERLQLAAVCGAFAVSVHGDWEGLPRPGELGLLDGHDVSR